MICGLPSATRSCFFALAAAAGLLVLFYLRWTASVRPLRPTTNPTQSPATEPDTLEALLQRDFWSREWAMCDSPQRRPVLFNNDIWQHPFNTSFYALAAYPDRRLRARRRVFAYVRVVAMRDNYGTGEIHCQLEFAARTVSVPAQVELIWERRWDPANTGRLYDPVLVSCPLRATRLPLSVALTAEECGPADTRLPVDSRPLQRYMSTGRRAGFAVCVKGLDLTEDVSGRLVEWIEMHRLLGADAIFFYHYRTHERVARVLRHFEATGLVTVINMTLPGFQPNYAPDRSRYLRAAVWQKRRNELVHYNDCLYRNLYRYRFVVPVDVDELLVPLQYETWPELLEHLERVNPRLLHRYASLSARHVYFFDNLTRAPDPQLPAHFHMLRHTERSANISGPGVSCKSFVSTRGALTVFNHYALRALYPYMAHEVRVVPRQALLHHYRPSCPQALLQECRDNFYRFTVADSSLERYRERLVSAVNRTLRALQN